MPKPTATRTTIADQLKNAIRESGKTVNALAVEAGVPQPVLHRFVKGERDLTLTTVQKLADYFGLRLVGRSRKPKREER